LRLECCAFADNTRLEVAGLQSTSNIIVSDEVIVDTDRPLLWMTEFHDPVQLPETQSSTNGQLE
jgi:hypothetical protein